MTRSGTKGLKGVRVPLRQRIWMQAARDERVSCIVLIVTEPSAFMDVGSCFNVQIECDEMPRCKTPKQIKIQKRHLWCACRAGARVCEKAIESETTLGYYRNA